MAKQVCLRSESEVPMDVVSAHSSGTGPVGHYELPTADALEAKLVVERDSASALRDEIDMLRKQTTQRLFNDGKNISPMIYQVGI